MFDIREHGYVEQHVDSKMKTGRIKETSGQIYTLDGYNLLTTVNYKNIEFIQQGDRVIVTDSKGRIAMDMNVYDMDGWYIKDYGDGVEEHIFSIKDKGVMCKMVVKGCTMKVEAC